MIPLTGFQNIRISPWVRSLSWSLSCSSFESFILEMLCIDQNMLMLVSINLSLFLISTNCFKTLKLMKKSTSRFFGKELKLSELKMYAIVTINFDQNFVSFRYFKLSFKMKRKRIAWLYCSGTLSTRFLKTFYLKIEFIFWKEMGIIYRCNWAFIQLINYNIQWRK